MATKTKNKVSNIKVFDPTNSINRAERISAISTLYARDSRMDRVEIIRKGLPYESIEDVILKVKLPVKQMLQYIGVPQTTYNKGKRENVLLPGRYSEIVLALSDLFDFGLEVFNNEEEKFQRWLTKPNLSLGGVTPESLFDTMTGIQEVNNALNRLEYGNMA